MEVGAQDLGEGVTLLSTPAECDGPVAAGAEPIAPGQTDSRAAQEGHLGDGVWRGASPLQKGPFLGI